MSIDLQNLNEQLRELQPPQLRDRLIFEAVVVKQRSQTEVAAEHGISQPRVSQIVVEVGKWLDHALPRARQNESAGGEMAVGTYVVEAQIDLLLQQTMHDLAESRKDKVTEKAGTRGVVNWTETKTEKRQIVKVGLLDMALRLAQAKAKLAGVDVTGRAQREMALAEERERTEGRGPSTQVKKQERAPKKSLIARSEKSEAAAKMTQPQVQEEPVVSTARPIPEAVKQQVLNQLITSLRKQPSYAGWTDSQFQDYAEWLWEDERRQQREKDSGQQPDLPQSLHPQSGKLWRKRTKHRSPQDRRREFLAPLAAG